MFIRYVLIGGSKSVSVECKLQNLSAKQLHLEIYVVFGALVCLLLVLVKRLTQELPESHVLTDPY